MNKYTLRFADTAFIEYTESEFNSVPNIDITGLVDNEVVKGKQLQVKSPKWKYGAMIIMPIDNFEVLDDMENN